MQLTVTGTYETLAVVINNCVPNDYWTVYSVILRISFTEMKMVETTGQTWIIVDAGAALSPV